MNEISIGIISSICFLYLAFRRNQKISSSLILDIFARLLTNREKSRYRNGYKGFAFRIESC